jgi:hypothetical protein
MAYSLAKPHSAKATKAASPASIRCSRHSRNRARSVGAISSLGQVVADHIVALALDRFVGWAGE